MKVLMVSVQAPTGPLNGLRLPLRQLMYRLDQAPSIHVSLVAYRLQDQPADDTGATRLVPRPEPGRAGRAWELAGAMVSRRPASSRRLVSGLLPHVQREIEMFEPDVLHVFGAQLAGLARHLGGRPCILTAMDADSRNLQARADVARGLRRIAMVDEVRRHLRYQSRTFPLWSRIVMVTDEDAELVRQQAPGTRTVTIPNGVDAPADGGERPYTGPRPVVLFHGALSYAPNVLAIRHLIEDVWPAVRAQRPDAHLVLVGRSPAPEVRRLAETAGVQLIGEVPDVWPWLRDADVYVCPMTSGTGVKNKLLEAMAAGLPCVVTPLATQGLTVRDGEHLLIREDSGSMASAIVALMADPHLLARLGTRARDLVTREYSWDRYSQAYQLLYTDVIADGASHSA